MNEPDEDGKAIPLFDRRKEVTTRYARHKVTKSGQCSSCGKQFPWFVTEISAERQTAVVEEDLFARTDIVSFWYESLLNEQEREAVVDCMDVVDPFIAGEIVDLERLFVGRRKD